MFKQLDLAHEPAVDGQALPMTPRTSTYSVVSLFSGCGGMDFGFQGGFKFLGKRYAKQPFDIKWANDFNEAACAHISKMWVNIFIAVIFGKI